MPETATEAKAPARANDVSISDAGPSRKKLTIRVPAETVSEKLKESLDTLAVEADLPGFRRGRAPKALLEKRFGPTLRTETKKQLVTEAFAKAVEESKLRIVGDPIGDHLEKVEVTDGKPLVFEIEVEVMPEFELPPLDGIEVKRPTIEVTDAMVDDEIRKLCVNEGRLEERPEPEPGDYITGRGIMKGEDGTEFYNIPGAVIQVPSADKAGRGMILGILVDDFATQLGLPKPGQTASVRATGPDNHEIEKVRGAKLTITFQVDRVDRINPASVEDVVKGFGFSGEPQLREVIRTRLDQRVMVQQQAAMRQQVAAHLISSTAMDLPERLTAQQAARTLERQRLEMMYRGIEPATIEERMAELRAGSGRIAADELKLIFVLARAAEDLKVRVEEAEVNGRIAQLAMERNMRPEALRQELIQRNQVGTVVQQVREHKTLDTILAKAKVTDVPAEEFNRAVAPSRPQPRPKKPDAKAEAGEAAAPAKGEKAREKVKAEKADSDKDARPAKKKKKDD
jgi:trigger factor